MEVEHVLNNVSQRKVAKVVPMYVECQNEYIVDTYNTEEVINRFCEFSDISTPVKSPAVVSFAIDEDVNHSCDISDLSTPNKYSTIYSYHTDDVNYTFETSNVSSTIENSGINFDKDADDDDGVFLSECQEREEAPREKLRYALHSYPISDHLTRPPLYTQRIGTFGHRSSTWEYKSETLKQQSDNSPGQFSYAPNSYPITVNLRRSPLQRSKLAVVKSHSTTTTSIGIPPPQKKAWIFCLVICLVLIALFVYFFPGFPVRVSDFSP